MLETDAFRSPAVSCGAQETKRCARRCRRLGGDVPNKDGCEALLQRRHAQTKAEPFPKSGFGQRGLLWAEMYLLDTWQFASVSL